VAGEDVQQAKEALAHLTGLHYTKVSRVENGQQPVTDEEMRVRRAGETEPLSDT
jgi:hypothetical protein